MAERTVTCDSMRLPGLVALLCAALAVCTAEAELPSTNARSLAENRNAAEGSNPAELNARSPEDRETERIVLELVQTHLPELTSVLKRLRSDQPREYELAVKDLAKAARKLELAQNRDQRLFESELELFQAEQQASLLTARLKVRDSLSDRKRLREVAARLQQAQMARAQYDVDVFRQRLNRAQQQLDAAIARLDSRKDDADQQLDRSYQTMLRKAGRDLKRDTAIPLPSQDRTEKPSPPSRGSASPASE